MKVLLDTNVFLVSLAPQSEYAVIFEFLLNGAFELVISNEILTEYEEIIARRYDHQTIEDIFDLLNILPNVERQEAYFQWNLITNDPEDNKFVDCAIASNADFIVTNDRQFEILKNVEFPVVPIINAAKFIALLQ